MLYTICSADILNADWIVCRGEEMNRFKRIKLTRAQKTIRNIVIAAVFIAAVPMLFNVHFTSEAAAQEVLEEAGLTDAKYIASHEFKTKPAFAKNRYTISKRFYEADIDGDSYMITVPYNSWFGVVYKAETPDIVKASDRVKIASVKRDENDSSPDYISGRRECMRVEARNPESLYAEFAREWLDYDCYIEVYRNLNDEQIISFSVSYFSDGFCDDYKGGCDIIMNIDTQEILSLVPHESDWNPVHLEDRHRMSSEVKYKGKMSVTEERAKYICNTLYAKVADYIQQEGVDEADWNAKDNKECSDSYYTSCSASSDA